MAVSYTQDCRIPKYVPDGRNVELEDCVDVSKYESLCREIDLSLGRKEISESESVFLKLLASRWIRFSYADIAQWYCTKASVKMQRHLERTAAVVVDMDKAFETALVNHTAYLKGALDRLKDSGEPKLQELETADEQR